MRRHSPAPAAGEGPVTWLTAADISRLWHLPQGSVYRLASERRWRRRSRGGRTYYHGTDVTSALQRREQRQT
ncbi:hypothetical protein G5C65_11295 [Streptomyces sp. SB3404]|uniref:Helix-turn-helix domain-containing protein n=2 Tax=Streptomyces boncukensis TaxID=2711219 RepID=A0A6G4WUG9_9ACTN|nr:hypothetical protein [Streptomyces boncukensis]